MIGRALALGPRATVAKAWVRMSLAAKKRNKHLCVCVCVLSKVFFLFVFIFWPYLASLLAQLAKNPPAQRETLVQLLGLKDPLEKG